jgi:hypothetical protein
MQYPDYGKRAFFEFMGRKAADLSLRNYICRSIDHQQNPNSQAGRFFFTCASIQG